MKILENMIDLHIHGGPDIVPRKLLDSEVVAAADAEGMGAVVLKSHLGSTVERAILMEHMMDQNIKVFGGIALNSFIGGFNKLATQAALRMGAKIVWMPTFTAKNHLEFERKRNKSVNALSSLCQELEGLSVLNEAGDIAPAVVNILELVAASEAVLSCGHIGIAESRVLVTTAKKCHVEKIIYSHPNNPINSVTLNDQKWLVREGVVLERCLVDVISGLVGWDELFQEINATGVSNNLISTDLGQLQNITPVLGMKLAYEKMCEYGFSQQDIAIMTSINQQKLLGM